MVTNIWPMVTTDAADLQYGPIDRVDDGSSTLASRITPPAAGHPRRSLNDRCNPHFRVGRIHDRFCRVVRRGTCTRSQACGSREDDRVLVEVLNNCMDERADRPALPSSSTCELQV